MLRQVSEEWSKCNVFLYIFFSFVYLGGWLYFCVRVSDGSWPDPGTPATCRMPPGRGRSRVCIRRSPRGPSSPWMTSSGCIPPMRIYTETSPFELLSPSLDFECSLKKIKHFTFYIFFKYSIVPRSVQMSVDIGWTIIVFVRWISKLINLCGKKKSRNILCGNKLFTVA